MKLQKTLQAFLQRLENKKLLHVSSNKKSYKIWVNVKIILNELLQTMIDSEATDNYILQKQ
jgi:hypothetical protein